MPTAEEKLLARLTYTFVPKQKHEPEAAATAPPKRSGVRSTSRAAYDEVKPAIGEKQQAVYVALQMSKRPVCNQELADYLGWPINTVTPRCNELVELGKVQEAFKAVYPKTGRKVIYWTVAGKHDGATD